MPTVAKKRTATGFGARLRELRQARGLTQEQLGDRVGMAYQAIARIERGNNPAWDTAVKLAEALGVSMDEFKGG